MNLHDLSRQSSKFQRLPYLASRVRFTAIREQVIRHFGQVQSRILNDLLKKGLITQEEYKVKRAEILKDA